MLEDVNDFPEDVRENPSELWVGDVDGNTVPLLTNKLGALDHQTRYSGPAAPVTLQNQLGWDKPTNQQRSKG